MGRAGMAPGLMCLVTVVALMGCITEKVYEGTGSGHGEERTSSSGGGATGRFCSYRIGEFIEGVPEESFATAFDRWERGSPTAGRVRLRFHLIIEYHGRTESEDEASWYFRQLASNLSVVGGEYEFGTGSPQLPFSAEWRILLPRENVSGWVEFTVPDWFRPTDLVWKRDDRVLWRVSLEEAAGGPMDEGRDSSPSGGLNPSVELVGPSYGNPGDIIVLSVRNLGNVDLRSWDLVGPGLSAKSQQVLRVGSQKSFTAVLEGPDPWVYTVTAETADGQTCSDTLTVRKG